MILDQIQSDSKTTKSKMKLRFESHQAAHKTDNTPENV